MFLHLVFVAFDTEKLRSSGVVTVALAGTKGYGLLVRARQAAERP